MCLKLCVFTSWQPCGRNCQKTHVIEQTLKNDDIKSVDCVHSISNSGWTKRSDWLVKTRKHTQHKVNDVWAQLKQ